MNHAAFAEKEGFSLDGSCVQELADGKTLKVTDIKVTDAGRYTCMATNVAGQMEKTFKLVVQGESPSPFFV